MAGPRQFSPKRQRLLLVCAGLVMLGISATLALRALEDNLVFFYTPSMLGEQAIAPGTTFRLGGLVAKGSITHRDDHTISFVVTDGDATLTVHYTDILPNLFREGQGVVAEGTLRDDTTFIARTVLAKHDENYMPPDMQKTLQEKGLWKPGGGEPPTP